MTRRAWTTMLAAALLVGACEHDDPGKLSKRDYQTLLERQAPPEPKKPEPPIPELQPVLAAPSPVVAAEERLVSVSVNETVPLKDLLQELARKAGVDIELDPEVRGSIIFSARERPFREVIERIADLGNLRYTLKNGMLRVEPDRMFHKTYRIDAINAVRTSSSSVDTTTDVFSSIAGAGGGGSQQGNGSKSSVQTATTANVWEEMASNIDQILKNTAPVEAGLSFALPTAVPVSAASPQPAAATVQTPVGSIPVNPAQAVPTQGNVATQGLAGVAAGLAAGGSGQMIATDAMVPPPLVTPLPAPPAPRPTNLPYFSINKQTGLISVFGNNRQHEQVRRYIERVDRLLSAQVLIEAKIIEVTLSEQNRTGIDWSAVIGGGSTTATVTGNFFTGLTSAATTAATSLTPATLVLSKGTDFLSTVSLIERFGTVRTISNPRQTVVNNQAALLKVAQNEVYFTLTMTPGTAATTTSAATQPTINSTPRTVPEGVVMMVLPVVDLDAEKITLSLRPTITRISRREPDPATKMQAALALAALGNNTSPTLTEQIENISSSIPVLEVREMDSVVRLESGQTVLLGGLMQERYSNTENGVPGAMDVPVVGNAFKANERQTQMTELVIMLRATILGGSGGGVSPADKDLYRKFFSDPRPVAF